MNRVLELAVLGLGGLSLFVVAFLGFAAMSGAPLSELAVIGPLFEDPEPIESEAPPSELESVADFGGAQQIYTTQDQVVEANTGLLAAYALEPPLTATELQNLALDLKTTKVQFEERLRALDKRERDLSEREELMSHQFQTLDELKAELERFETELELRESELLSKENTASTASAGLGSVSKLFETGSAEDLTGRLLQYPPAEAATILSHLDSERAAQLLNSLPPDRWKEYVDAFSAISTD